MSNRLVAAQVVLGILDDLEDRAGVGDAIDNIDREIYDDMIVELTDIAEKIING